MTVSVTKQNITNLMVDLGNYNTKEEAARAYDKVALQNHGAKAKTNFDYLEEEVQKILSDPPLLKLTVWFVISIY